MDTREMVFSIHRTSLFERCLKDLQKRGGIAETAVKKAEEFIRAVTRQDGQGIREKYSFTRHGEARIRNCGKTDLGGGYRIVGLLKDGQLALLYAGSHDECSRWLMRNRRMKYEFQEAVQAVSVARERAPVKESVPVASGTDQQISDDYEKELMSRIDDAILRKVFSGLVSRSGTGTQ